MKLKVKLKNRAALRSGEDIQGNQFAFECDPSELPQDVRRLIADRLHEDSYLCQLNEKP